MTTILSAAEIWRDFETDGVPASGAHKPVKRDIKLWGAMLESMLAQLGLGYATLVALNADLAHGASTLAMVYADATAANNGVYVKSGNSGAGAWTRVGDLPDAIIPLTVTGGTADAIVATAPSTPLAPQRHLYLLTPTANNTGAATIAVNGASAVAIKNALNANLASGSLIMGNAALMCWSTDHYQLLVAAAVDGNAILADAVAAKDAAEAAAADAVAIGGTVGYSTVAAFAAATVTVADGTMVYIQNYYAGINGGAHWCRIASSLPAHPLYHTSANGKYAVFSELNPNILQLGVRMLAGDDCGPAYNNWLKYCVAEAQCSSLHFPSGNWVWNTRPDPIFLQSNSFGRKITGEGKNATVFYVYYSTSAYFGLLHLLPQGSLVVRGIGMIGQRTDTGNGTGIAAHDGHTQYLQLSSLVIGQTITVTIGGVAVSTVVASTDAAATAVTIAHSINADGTIPAQAEMPLAVPVDDKIVLLSKASSPSTMTVSGSGAASVAQTILGAQTCGNIHIDGCEITGAVTAWTWSALFDGTRQDMNPLGIRSIFVSNSNFFGASAASVSIKGCDNVNFSNTQVVLAGGVSGSLEITGIAGHATENFKFDGGFINNVVLDYVKYGVITTGKILQGVVNSANTDSFRIVCPHIDGGVSNLWTNSSVI